MTTQDSSDNDGRDGKDIPGGVWSHRDTPLTVGGGKMRYACNEQGDTVRKGWIHLFPPAL